MKKEVGRLHQKRMRPLREYIYCRIMHWRYFSISDYVSYNMEGKIIDEVRLYGCRKCGYVYHRYKIENIENQLTPAAKVILRHKKNHT